MVEGLVVKLLGASDGAEGPYGCERELSANRPPGRGEGLDRQSSSDDAMFNTLVLRPAIP